MVAELVGWRNFDPFSEPLIDVQELPGASSIRVDLRYASSNNFTGHVLYEQARCLLRRRCAKALVRVQRRLSRAGYGLVIYDAYRPWSVTAMLWEATAPGMQEYVANPARGSLHNRGGAVDVGLYHLDRYTVLLARLCSTS